MKIHKKLALKAFNYAYSVYGRLRGGTGLIPNIKDDRDYVSELGLFPYKPKHETVSHFVHQFDQNPFNICVFAGGVLAVSDQTGIRWSVKFAVKLAKKLGMISGNGFSYQRAVLEIITKYGLVPYEAMPDEINENWNEYSKWTPEAQRLLDEVAPQYKFTEYQKLRSESAVLEALDNGYVVITASNWYSDMFNPRGPLYLLRFSGGYVGGHQYRSTGYRGWGTDFEAGNTYGKDWGKNGTGFLETLFGKGRYDNWIVNYEGQPTLPTKTLIPLFTKQNEGKLVRSRDNNACYVIQDGMKHGVPTSELYQQIVNRVGQAHTIVNFALLEATPKGEPYSLTN